MIQVLDKECLITKVEAGSIIITLKGCGQYSLRRLFAKGVQGPVTNILRHIFLLPNIRKLIPINGLEFELTLKCLPPEQHTERKSNSDLVITHMEFLLEELDALSFLTTLKEKASLTDEEVKTILSTKPMSRKTRTKAMLEKLLEKDTVDDFVDVLKKKKTYVWQHVFQAVDKRLLIPTNAVAKSYNELVDNMCPKLISEECCTTTFILSDLDSSWSRERQARYVLQQVLKQDFDTKLHFVSIIFLYDHIPPEITSKATKRMQKSAPRKAGQKTDQRPKIQPTEIFVGDFVVSTNERKGKKPVKAYCNSPLNPISFTRSITRRLEKTTRKDKAGQDTTFC
ncbi:uncharacterized protein LOC128546198 [Mercenaria mercenaria]|uniref:uncharacterized protein LOC128546198 n=1 Tax=Mercenaria mercenaria TaxID=6596 RepID=UPI00234EBFFE|nr:uncharacterized protein LOC128546198 [Mercenaria mercenaria]